MHSIDACSNAATSSFPVGSSDAAKPSSSSQARERSSAAACVTRASVASEESFADRDESLTKLSGPNVAMASESRASRTPSAADCAASSGAPPRTRATNTA
eukprot:Amastigsp_a849161_28.p5 type:complete len:101 gc:universal Amastigsp_a849161_28:653-955(+)